MAVSELQRLFDYGYWAGRRLLEAVARLTPEQFTQPPAGTERSVRATLVHVMSAEWGWIDRCGGTPRGPALKPEDFPDVASVSAAWRRVEGHVRELLSRLGDADLERRVEFTLPPGLKHVMAVGEMLQHAAVHGIHHRGQVALLLRLMGQAPPGLDMLLYFAEGAERAGGFANVYDDAARAAAYDRLEFPGTYALAYRDLPALIREHVRGRRALDFGCGTGRSTRFLKGLGFEVVGVDVSEPMLARARQRDPQGDYRLVGDGGLDALEEGRYDLVLSAFTFDNVPTAEKKVELFRGLARMLTAQGRILNLVSAPEIYVNEWASFSTRDFPQNRAARCGDTVRIVMLDVDDRRPVEDIVWTEEGYRDVYERAGLQVLQVHKPLGRPEEAQAWVSETRIAPWVVYVLARRSS